MWIDFDVGLILNLQLTLWKSTENVGAFARNLTEGGFGLQSCWYHWSDVVVAQ